MAKNPGQDTLLFGERKKLILSHPKAQETAPRLNTHRAQGRDKAAPPIFPVSEPNFRECQILG